MDVIRCSLLTDGPSDVALIPLLRWLMRQHSRFSAVEVEWANLGRFRQQPRDLSMRIVKAIEFFPSDVLFIHRDSEAQAPEMRYGEIAAAVKTAANMGCATPHICVVPVRMQEAWLLLDEAAIRNAAGNPNSRIPLALPKANRIESIPDPKQMLHDALRIASELRGRRLKKFRADRLALRVADYMKDFACLRVLPAFQQVEAQIQKMMPTLTVAQPKSHRAGE